jgi:hypothetical protein
MTSANDVTPIELLNPKQPGEDDVFANASVCVMPGETLVTCKRSNREPPDTPGTKSEPTAAEPATGLTNWETWPLKGSSK